MFDFNAVAVGVKRPSGGVLRQGRLDRVGGGRELARCPRRLHLRGEVSRHIHPAVTRCLGVGQIRRDGVLAKRRRIQKLPRQLEAVGLEDRVNHGAT